MEVEWLKHCCKKWRELPNDVAKQEARTKLRHAAIEKGFTNIDVSNTIRTVRNEANEDKQPQKAEQQPPQKPVVLDDKPEGGGGERPVRTAQGFKDIPRGTGISHEPKVGMNPSGGKLRSKNTPSIVDGDFK